MPSAKYALAFSSLRFSKGRTATLFSGMGTGTLLVAAGDMVDVISRDGLWKKIKELIIRARAEPAKATESRNFGNRGWLTGRTGAESCFHLRRLRFLGTSGLPRPSLQRLNKCRRRACFTSHSPRS